MFVSFVSFSFDHSTWNLNASMSFSHTVTSGTFASDFTFISAASLDHTVILFPVRSHDIVISHHSSTSTNCNLNSSASTIGLSSILATLTTTVILLVSHAGTVNHPISVNCASSHKSH
jgi:hypothetical protein